ncbi:hypothetical protein CPB83DRAFT_853570 [Crepidotus variabilis]|uniref:Uncharacterized protein n=1 Tax=Crepidotus variabilis TaxID=179855 RepID=A0A9P6EHC3_9AGAR|nr:hypothetical protein CPB83DRAFT_853570 [Crepidotus variabilis]
MPRAQHTSTLRIWDDIGIPVVLIIPTSIRPQSVSFHNFLVECFRDAFVALHANCEHFGTP